MPTSKPSAQKANPEIQVCENRIPAACMRRMEMKRALVDARQSKAWVLLLWSLLRTSEFPSAAWSELRFANQPLFDSPELAEEVIRSDSQPILPLQIAWGAPGDWIPAFYTGNTSPYTST